MPRGHKAQNFMLWPYLNFLNSVPRVESIWRRKEGDDLPGRPHAAARCSTIVCLHQCVFTFLKMPSVWRAERRSADQAWLLPSSLWYVLLVGSLKALALRTPPQYPWLECDWRSQCKAKLAEPHLRGVRLITQRPRQSHCSTHTAMPRTARIKRQSVWCRRWFAGGGLRIWRNLTWRDPRTSSLVCHLCLVWFIIMTFLWCINNNKLIKKCSRCLFCCPFTLQGFKTRTILSQMGDVCNMWMKNRDIVSFLMSV